MVIGEPTAGAVLISQDTPLPDGGRLSLSRSDFVTAAGVRLEKRGVMPDVRVAAPDPAGPSADPVLDLAIATLARPDAQRVETAAPAL